MMKRALKMCWIWALVAVFLLGSAVSAESMNVNTIKLNQVRQSDANLTMYVSLKDPSGRPCTGAFRADQFSISVDGKALDVDSIEPFDPSTQPIHYVFSLDVSKSLTPAMMQSVRAALTSFASEIGPLDTISILTFGERVTTLIGYGQDLAQIQAVIDGLQPSENMTALYKGVIDGVDLASAVLGRCAVIVITDGKNDPTADMQSYTKESIYERVRSAQVPLYCIGLNDNNGVDAESLAELAAVTGGDQYVIQSSEVYNYVSLVRDIIRSAMSLHATLVNTDNKAGFDEVSTFKVGFQPDGGAFLTSNELQQVVNWKNVPAPVYTPEPTPVPQISLELDTAQIEYVPGGAAVLTGAIEVEQGEVAPEMLSVSVNSVTWPFNDLQRNGDGYTFSIQGALTGDETELEVKAEIADLGIASRVQRVAVTLPTQAPTATPSPILSVELDDAGRDLPFVPGQTVSVSGVINVQGSVNPGDLELYVNDALHEMTVQPINDNQFEFSAEITPQEDDPTEFSLQVRLSGEAIYSRAQRLYFATPSPSPTPEAVALSVDLDDPGRELMFIPGTAIPVSGAINIQGSVNPDDLRLYVNGEPHEMALLPINDDQYEFNAEIALDEGDPTELSLQIRLGDEEIYSRAQRLYLATPSPTPNPELNFSLNETSVEYVEGEAVTIRGTIEVSSGDIAPEDLALYVGNIKWDMQLTPQGDGTYRFEASNSLVDGEIDQLDVRVRLVSNMKISSNSEKLAVTTPTPAPTPTQTPRPEITPPPTSEPTKAPPKPTAAATEPPVEAPTGMSAIVARVKGVVQALIDNGTIWFVAAGAAIILILIVVLIVLLVRRARAKKSKIVPVSPTGSFVSPSSQNDAEVGATHRDGDAAETERDGTHNSMSDFVDGSGAPAASGTRRIGTEGGTVRLDEGEAEGGGTRRIDDDMRSVEITLDESYRQQSRGSRTLRLNADDEVVFGRSDRADQIIDDDTVSGRHMAITFDGVSLYIQDLGSTNGTKINGEVLIPREARMLNDADAILIGKTTLKLRIGEPESY